MTLLSINSVSKIGREQPLFTEVTFGLQEGEKAALIGRNGTGKSTLLSIIAGKLEPDSGTVVHAREGGVSYLPQNPEFKLEDTIRDHIFKSHSPKLEIIRQYLETCEALETNPNLQNKLFELNQKMDEKDLWNYEAQVQSVLSTLGISTMDKKMGELSGGMVKKVALAQVLVEDTKLLLLDEPTNHLDIRTITYLQDYLANTKRSLLMVTHDRYFLDAVCTNIYELARGKIKLYQGNYSQYLEKKEIEAEIEANTERRIESVLRFERQWLLRGPCARGTKIKARIQRDMQLINREKFQADKGFTFEVEGRRLGGKVLELHGIGKNYLKDNKNPVFQDFSYTFTKGQKIGIYGENGSGKSTFLNIVTGRLQPDTGSVVVGENTHFGYYTQNPVFENVNMTVLEYVKEVAQAVKTKDGTVIRPERFLEEFGFEGKIQYSPVSSLSGGERKRLFLVRLLLTNPNFLILDEPTNDFDIFTMNILEDFLMGYQGCLLIVSHDRYFMDKVADTLFILDKDGGISGFVGKCSEYIEYEKEKEAEALAQSGTKANVAKGGAGIKNTEKSDASPNSAEKGDTNSQAGAATSKKKLSFKEQREFDQLEKDIETLESRKAELEEIMSAADRPFEEIDKANKEYQTLSADLDAKYARWEELAI